MGIKNEFRNKIKTNKDNGWNIKFKMGIAFKDLIISKEIDRKEWIEELDDNGTLYYKLYQELFTDYTTDITKKYFINVYHSLKILMMLST